MAFAKMELEAMVKLLTFVKDENDTEFVEDKLKRLAELQRELAELEFDLKLHTFDED